MAAEQRSATRGSAGGCASDPVLLGDVRIESVDSCPLCTCRDLELLFTASDTLHQMPGEWGVRRCRECALMFTSPRPDRKSMASFYPDGYQPHAAPFAPQTYPAWKRLLKPITDRLFDPKEIVLPTGQPPGKVLEVGCGSGRLLVQLARMGWDVHGLEPSESAVERLRSHTNIVVDIGTIDSISFKPESFDLVVALMVLEHLHDPVADVMRLHRWLRPGTSVVGSVPNCGSWEFRVFGPRWYALQVPTHLNHFTPHTIRSLFRRAGFRKTRIYHQRDVKNLMVHAGRFLASRQLPLAQTFLEFPERGHWALRYAVHPAATLLVWLGQSGRITFLATRD